MSPTAITHGCRVKGSYQGKQIEGRVTGKKVSKFAGTVFYTVETEDGLVCVSDRYLTFIDEPQEVDKTKKSKVVQQKECLFDMTKYGGEY